MWEKRIKPGSKIKLKRKLIRPDDESKERLGERSISGSADHVDKPESKESTNVTPETDDLANIFRKREIDIESNKKSPFLESAITPPPIPKTIKKISPLLTPDSSKSDKNYLASQASDEYSFGINDDAMEHEVELIRGIDKTTGNYLLTLGYPGSGKTVLQSFLYYYIATHGDFSNRIEQHREGAQPDYLTESLLNKWLFDWNNHKLPEATKEDELAIREIRMQLTPRVNTSKIFNFSFIELSGELIKSIVPTELQAGSIVKTMNHFLTAPSIKKIIIYVFDHEKNNDELFSSLIRYLERSVPGKLDKVYSLMIVVPNPDLVLQRVSSKEFCYGKYSNDIELKPEALLQYLRINAPQLVATFRSWKKSKRGIFKFHIGSVSKNTLSEQILKNYDFKDSRRIIDFCYRQFQGAKLRGGLLGRIAKAMRS